MKTFVAVMLCSALAFGAEPGDAPVRDVPGTSVHLEAGSAAPFTGRLLSDAEAVKSEQQATADHTTAAKVNAACEGKDCVYLPRSVVVTLIVSGATLALAAGVTGYAVGKLRR